MYFDNYHNPAGFVEVSKYYDELFEEALSPTTSSSIDITVYDEDGRQIYPDTASGGEKRFDYFTKLNSRDLSSHSARIYNDLKQQKEFVTVCPLDYSGFTVTASINNTGFYTPILASLMWIPLLALSLFVVCYFVAGFLSRRLAQPLTEMHQFLSQSDSAGKFRQISLKDSGVIEIDRLRDSLNSSIRAQEAATESLLVMKESEIQAQMLALQAQMNPHFIHNTLFIVQAYAREENFKMVDEICEELSDMIRYSANWQQNVTLGEELRHVDCYMKLVKCRYEDGVRYFVKCDSVSEAIRMPQFILQPIVENSLEHGLKKREFPWIIEIKCYTENNCWMIEIWDNGIGITPDKKSEILLFLENIKMGNQDILEQGLKIGGLSLKNVIARLYLKYGENMYFDITEKREGTSVILGGSMDD